VEKGGLEKEGYLFFVCGFPCRAMKCAIFSAGVISCGQVSSQRAYEGVAGVLLDKENRWRGAVIGGALGGVLGGTTTEIAQRAAREAAMANRSVEYRSEDGRQRVYRVVKTNYYQVCP